jgi:hypothetical protein
MGAASCNSDSDSLKDSNNAVQCILKGRIGKKRGLSRHYPHKAQSFDCIASLFANSNNDESSLKLSKSLSMRSGASRQHSHGSNWAPQDRSPSALRRITSSITIHECPMEEWRCTESDLCCALQSQATLQQQQQHVGTEQQDQQLQQLNMSFPPSVASSSNTGQTFQAIAA